MANRKRTIMELAGAWSNMSDEEAEAMKRRIRKMRRRSTRALVAKVKRWNAREVGQAKTI